MLSPSGSTIVLSNVAVNSQPLGNLTVNFGAGGLTQYASAGGTTTINQIQQDGYSAGQLQSVAVNNSGLVVGTFSNGQNLNLAAVSLSHFNGPNFLKPLDGGAYAATDQSGVAIAGATGSIGGSAVEGSNTDIADEFTKLIVTQQAYSANTKVITTAQTMLQSLVDKSESISPDEVATELLALQTKLQASYQTTSMLSQMSLVKYLPVG